MKTDKILLGHGSGGKLTHTLLDDLIRTHFSNPILNRCDDSAVFKLSGKIAFTTDSFVVKPLFFPGGDIGTLAVCGTINDLAVMGAKPLYVTCAFIIEEGLELSILEKIIKSMKKTAKECSVDIVGGDLKVVEKNAADKIIKFGKWRK
jgi:hydrogenase expression/formation protein HypE